VTASGALERKVCETNVQVNTLTTPSSAISGTSRKVLQVSLEPPFSAIAEKAGTSGIWEGVATYLLIVSDYVARYRGKGLDLPAFVRTLAKFGGDRIRYGRGFLRIPILPHAARLYAGELRELILSGKLRGYPQTWFVALFGYSGSFGIQNQRK
jgi:hypothetical protein